MVNEKLEGIGNKLNISKDDIKRIKKERRRNRIKYIVSTAAISILTFILGIFAGISIRMFAGAYVYPFNQMSLAPVLITDRKPKSKIAILLVSAIGFLLVLKADASTAMEGSII